MNFELIKQVVEYSKQKYGNHDLSFSMTTNATLITEKIADFLAKNSFSITFSIDGPEEIHNMYRTNIYNVGSFNQSINGFKLLNKKYNEYNIKNKFVISIVYSPPYNRKKLEEIYEFFNNSMDFNNDVAYNITYPHKNSIPENMLINIKDREEITLRKWAFEKFVKFYKNNCQIPTFYKNSIETRLNQILRRFFSDFPNNNIFLNGCCIPFGRKIYICSNGDFKICERTEAEPFIGNIMEGLNLEQVKNILIKRYSEESIKFCSRCWGNKLCSLCYVHLIEDNNINIEKRNKYCKTEIESTIDYLILYSRLLEIRSDGLNYLAEYDIQ